MSPELIAGAFLQRRALEIPKQPLSDSSVSQEAVAGSVKIPGDVQPNGTFGYTNKYRVASDGTFYLIKTVAPLVSASSKGIVIEEKVKRVKSEDALDTLRKIAKEPDKVAAVGIRKEGAKQDSEKFLAPEAIRKVVDEPEKQASTSLEKLTKNYDEILAGINKEVVPQHKLPLEAQKLDQKQPEAQKATDVLNALNIPPVVQAPSVPVAPEIIAPVDLNPLNKAKKTTDEVLFKDSEAQTENVEEDLEETQEEKERKEKLKERYLELVALKKRLENMKGGTVTAPPETSSGEEGGEKDKESKPQQRRSQQDPGGSYVNPLLFAGAQREEVIPVQEEAETSTTATPQSSSTTKTASEYLQPIKNKVFQQAGKGVTTKAGGLLSKLALLIKSYPFVLFAFVALLGFILVIYIITVAAAPATIAATNAAALESIRSRDPGLLFVDNTLGVRGSQDSNFPTFVFDPSGNVTEINIEYYFSLRSQGGPQGYNSVFASKETAVISVRNVILGTTIVGLPFKMDAHPPTFVNNSSVANRVDEFAQSKISWEAYDCSFGLIGTVTNSVCDYKVRMNFKGFTPFPKQQLEANPLFVGLGGTYGGKILINATRIDRGPGPDITTKDFELMLPARAICLAPNGDVTRGYEKACSFQSNTGGGKTVNKPPVNQDLTTGLACPIEVDRTKGEIIKRTNTFHRESLSLCGSRKLPPHYANDIVGSNTNRNILSPVAGVITQVGTSNREYLPQGGLQLTVRECLEFNPEVDSDSNSSAERCLQYGNRSFFLTHIDDKVINKFKANRTIVGKGEVLGPYFKLPPGQTTQYWSGAHLHIELYPGTQTTFIDNTGLPEITSVLDTICSPVQPPC